jgi:hypothetical protein
MITMTELELVSLIGFAVMTFMYLRVREKLATHMGITHALFYKISRGEIAVIPTEDGFDLEPTAKAK